MTLVVGCCLLLAWLLLLTMNALDYTNFSFLPELLEVSVAVAVCGVILADCWIIWLCAKPSGVKTVLISRCNHLA